MLLTLRPIGLSSDPNRQDWSIYEDGAEIGRLYEDLQSTDPENHWYWSITLMGSARFPLPVRGPRADARDREGRFPQGVGPVQGSQRIASGLGFLAFCPYLTGHVQASK